jgi:hypothetical protein
VGQGSGDVSKTEVPPTSLALGSPPVRVPLSTDLFSAVTDTVRRPNNTTFLLKILETELKAARVYSQSFLEQYFITSSIPLAL